MFASMHVKLDKLLKRLTCTHIVTNFLGSKPGMHIKHNIRVKLYVFSKFFYIDLQNLHINTNKKINQTLLIMQFQNVLY